MSLHLISPGGIFVKNVQKYFLRVGTTRVVPEVSPLRILCAVGGYGPPDLMLHILDQIAGATRSATNKKQT